MFKNSILHKPFDIFLIFIVKRRSRVSSRRALRACWQYFRLAEGDLKVVTVKRREPSFFPPTCINCRRIFINYTHAPFTRMQMAAEEMDVIGPDVDQREENLPPLDSDEPAAPLDFSELTPCQFGISLQSFTPKLSSNCKDKSRLAQIKARRRSTIGTRGSPETNSLIRFMAQQRMKTACKTPELVRSSPFPRVASTLTQKMASFQILMDVEEESDACDPKQDGDAEGCIRTRDYLSDGSSHDACKENNPPVTPTPSKRRRLGPHEGCSQEIREAGTPTPHSNVKEVNEAPLPPSGSVEAAHAVLAPHVLDANVDFSARSSSRKHQDQVFEARSSSRPPPVDAAAASPPPPSSPFKLPSLPSLLETKPTDDGDSLVLKKKKQVHFGGPLSPEFFDKNLPPSTPLQKGGTPARVSTPGGSLQLRSLLKTPQRSQSKTPQSQPDLYSPSDFAASPTFTIPLRHRQGPEMVLPSFEETNSAAASDPDYLWDTQPLNLNSAFHEESLSQTETAAVSLEPDLQTSASCWINAEEESGSFTETKEKPEAADEDPSTSNKNKVVAEKKQDVATASCRSGSRKRKQPEEGQPVKRSTRSAAKSASRKMKTTLGGARQWSKEVDHSLYGSREYASKNPSLTPIREDLSITSESPAAPPTPFVFVAAATDDAHHPGTQSVEAAEARTLSGKSRRLSGPRARGRPPKKRKVRVPDRNLLSEENEVCGDQTEAPGSRSDHNAHEKEETARISQLTPERPPRSTLDGRSDSTETPVQKKRGRKSSALVAILQEQQNHATELQTPCGTGTRPGEQASNQQENIPSASVCPEESRLTGEVLAPWQAEFNFEDVFKPIATRGQHSVRRSLRLHCDLEHNGGGGEGLAWLPYTSPDSSKQARRRTRGRRLSAALPEVTQDAS